jgi:endonuclease YncB( thermonuclease family)
LRRYVDGRRVRCQPRENDKREARCWRDDQDLAELLVREGWARADRDASDDKYVDEEKEAKRARRGIWATAEENPEEVRRQQQRNY